MLPPVNSVPGTKIPPSQRLLARSYGHENMLGREGNLTPGGGGLPQWGALGPGAKACHTGPTIKERASVRQYLGPASPSLHCFPSEALRCGLRAPNIDEASLPYRVRRRDLIDKP